MSTHYADGFSVVDMTERLLTINQVAELLAVSRWTVYKLAREDGLRAVRVGERLRFRPADVNAYLERSREPAP